MDLNGIIIPPGASLNIFKWMGTAFVHSLYYCLRWSVMTPENFFLPIAGHVWLMEMSWSVVSA